MDYGPQTFVLSLATLALVFLLFVNLRLQIRGLRKNLGAFVQSQVMGALFQEEETTGANGVVSKRLVPRPWVRAAAAQMIPLLIGAAREWAKENIKLQPGAPGQPPQLDVNKLMDFVPKQFRPIAQMFAPQIMGFVGRLLGGAGGAAADSTKVAPNPFLGELGK